MGLELTIYLDDKQVKQLLAGKIVNAGKTEMGDLPFTVKIAKTGAPLIISDMEEKKP